MQLKYPTNVESLHKQENCGTEKHARSNTDDADDMETLEASTGTRSGTTKLDFKKKWLVGWFMEFRHNTKHWGNYGHSALNK